MARYTKSASVGISRDALRRKQEKRLADESTEGAKRPGRQALNEDTDSNTIKIYEPAARIEGGPLDGAVYYVSDLEARNRAAERMGEPPKYKRTNRHCTLPWTGGMKGEVWEVLR